MAPQNMISVLMPRNEPNAFLNVKINSILAHKVLLPVVGHINRSTKAQENYFQSTSSFG